MDVVSTILAVFSFVWTKVVPFIFVLSIVVFFHELGHFLVGRWNKVKVDVFSLGFGRELLGFTDKSGTRWKICLIPLGGYVKFFGDADVASRSDPQKIAEMLPNEREGTLESKSLLCRASVAAAGPLANFILASVIYTGFFAYFGDAKLAPVVGKVLEQSAGQEAGFMPADRIIRIDGEAVDRFDAVVERTTISSGRMMQVTVLRDGKEVDLQVTPRMTTRKDQFGNDYQVGLIGLQAETGPDSIVYIQLGFMDAFVASLRQIQSIIVRTYHVIRELLGGQRDVSQLRGPLGIAQMASQVATLGILQLVSLTAALSVSIGLMNLLPVPVLDGGHLLFYAVEAVRGKAIAAKTQEYAFRFGFLCLFALMIFVTFFDSSRIRDAWMQ